ncbi:NfeD family protein [Gracilibacillus suaedae]|uniref:NfeD family protein n=1 Tax=Gracilibacillus suaedae TaxID=2820273 RepID=UPI001ABEADB4|nr:NfeD family protein [Gracilibacillus suaedae]
MNMVKYQEIYINLFLFFIKNGNFLPFDTYILISHSSGGVHIGVLDIYWWILWGSLAVAIFSLLLGHVLDGILDSVFDSLGDFFNPLLVFGTLSVIGGAGVLLTKYSSLNDIYVLLISILIGIGAYLLIYYFLVIPMSNAESSTSISIHDLEGQVGEVITTIPAQGMGEVFISSTSGSRNETAKSFDQTIIKQGQQVVVVKVEDQILYVSELDEL